MSTTWTNRGHLYCPHITPVIVDCNFNVQPADTGGLGITNLKGQGVANVFMHTSATPGRGSNGYLNPNPANGIIMVQLSDNFNRLYCADSLYHAPNGAATTSTVANVVNVITVLGTATVAQWVAVGLPIGITPAVGVAFVATSAALIGGSAQTAIVAAAGAGIDHIEVCGVPALNLSPIPVGGSPNVGGFIYMSAYKNTVLTAPATGTVIRLSFYLSQSSVLVSGE